MANTYRSSGKHLPVVSASAAILSGAMVYQEGVVGVAITSAASGASLNVDTAGVHLLPVPSGVLKGDKLYFDDSAESVSLTLTETGTLNALFGVARGDRDADGNALVELIGKGLILGPLT